MSNNGAGAGPFACGDVIEIAPNAGVMVPADAAGLLKFPQ